MFYVADLWFEEFSGAPGPLTPGKGMASQVRLKLLMLCTTRMRNISLLLLKRPFVQIVLDAPEHPLLPNTLRRIPLNSGPATAGSFTFESACFACRYHSNTHGIPTLRAEKLLNLAHMKVDKVFCREISHMQGESFNTCCAFPMAEMVVVDAATQPRIEQMLRHLPENDVGKASGVNVCKSRTCTQRFAAARTFGWNKHSTPCVHCPHGLGFDSMLFGLFHAKSEPLSWHIHPNIS